MFSVDCLEPLLATLCILLQPDYQSVVIQVLAIYYDG